MASEVTSNYVSSSLQLNWSIWYTYTFFVQIELDLIECILSNYGIYECLSIFLSIFHKLTRLIVPIFI